MRVYEAIVKGLEGIGVTTAYGGAGENAAGLMLALEHSERIRGIITRNEQAASFMACGHAMYTDQLGFCFATAGPGAFNLLSGLAVAMSDSYPVLAVSGYANREWSGYGSLNETSGRGRTPDSLVMFGACTKGSFLLERLADTCDVLERAVNLAFEGRPGPVHITVPEDLTHDDVPNYRDISLEVAPVLPDRDQVDLIAHTLADALDRGDKVVLLAGFGAVRSCAGFAVREFVERFQIPVLTTLDGKGIVGEDHPLCVGVFCDSGHASAWKAFVEADVVLAVGNAFNQHATFNYREDLFEAKTLIHVNISAQEIGKTRFVPDIGLVSDARAAVEAIHAALEKRVDSLPRRKVDNQDYEHRAVLRIPGTSLHPGKLAQSLGRLLPPGAILLADAGAHLAWLGYYVELTEGQNFRKAGEFGPMAGHTNGALGIKVANPGRPVVVGCGDGCYNMSGFELMTAVEHDIPVVWVIFDDGEFKLIKLYQVSEYMEWGLTSFRNPDYAAYARACGANGWTVHSVEEFEDAFTAALASGRPSVIDARITRWAVPHYSPSPHGVIAGIVDTVEKRFRDD